MKLFVKNTLSGLIPLYPTDYDEKRKLRIGETYEVEIKRPRNVAFHRKFFALLNVGYSNTQLDMPFEAYRRYITMKAGYFKQYTTPKGVYFEAESISFASMDDDRFADLYDRVIDKIIEDTGADLEMIESELINFM